MKTNTDAARIEQAFKDYRCNFTVDAEGDGLPLVDVLAPPDDTDISRGKQELEYLIDFVLGEITAFAAGQMAEKERSEKKSWWESIGGTPIDWDDPRLEGVREAMKETQKEVIKAVKRREQLAAEYPVRSIVAPMIQEYKNAADSWYAQYMAWVKRGTEAEQREIILTTELAAERERRVAAEAVVDLYGDERNWIHHAQEDYGHTTIEAVFSGKNRTQYGYDKSRDYRKLYPKDGPLGAGENITNET